MEMGEEEIEHHIEVLEQRGQIYEFEGELRNRNLERVISTLSHG